jgi:group I intron endonuclease
MEYIYRIHNKIDGKDYVGLTNNPKRRKNRHFNDLANNQHDNPHLQKAYHKYGAEAFEYEILAEYDRTEEEIKQYEKQWIEKLDSYHNGYNCNPGGDLSYNPGKLSKQEVFEILSVTDKIDHKGPKLAEIYGVSVKVISNVRARHSYNRYSDEYDKLPQQEKDRLFVLMNSIHHFTKELNVNRRKFTREQIYMIYIARDYKLPFTLRSIAENFGMDISKTPFSIKDGSIYKDYYQDYYKLNIDDKNKILCDYIERYNMNPFELLETPTA